MDKKKCYHCNKILTAVNRKRLIDGTYLCKSCASNIPADMREFALRNWSYAEYSTVLSYFEHSRENLYPLFKETFRYKKIHLDAEHGLLYLSDGAFEKFTENTIIYEISNMTNFCFDLTQARYQENILSKCVIGNLICFIEMEYPKSRIMKPIADGIRCKVCKEGNNIEYILPDGALDCNLLIRKTYESIPSGKFNNTCAGKDDNFSHDEQETKRETPPPTNKKDDLLAKALTLYMFDSIEEVTEERLKTQRNRLIKTFHPDAEEIDEVFAQKINEAYEIIKKNL